MTGATVRDPAHTWSRTAVRLLLYTRGIECGTDGRRVGVWKGSVGRAARAERFRLGGFVRKTHACCVSVGRHVCLDVKVHDRGTRSFNSACST